MWESPVRVEEERHRIDVDAIEHRREVEPGHTVGCVQHHAQAGDGRWVDEGEAPVNEAVQQTGVGGLGAGFRGGGGFPCPGQAAHLGNARVAGEREGSRRHHLHPGVLGRVMACRNHRAGVVAALVHREVHHLGCSEPQRGDVCACRQGTTDECCGHRGGREAYVVTHRHACSAGDGDECPADALRTILVELGAVQAADVVGLEDLRDEGHAENPGRRREYVSSRCCGITRRSPMTGMKLVSPDHLGTTCR